MVLSVFQFFLHNRSNNKMLEKKVLFSLNSEPNFFLKMWLKS